MAWHNHKRSSSFATSAAVALALALAPSSLAATIGGGAAAPGAGTTNPSQSGGTTTDKSHSGGTTSQSGGVTDTSHGAGTTDKSQSGDTRKTSQSGGVRSARIEAVISEAHCVPTAKCNYKTREVSLHGGQLQLVGKRIGQGMTVLFASRRNGRALGPGAVGAPRARIRKTSAGLVVSIPKLARSGRIAVIVGGKRHTNLYGPIFITSKILHPPLKVLTTPIGASPTGTAFDGQGMWIWYISKSDGGDIPEIVEQAKDDGIGTLFVKSSDGTNWWSQFSSTLVEEVHAAGLKICGWQYVYGTSPVVEADLGAKAAEVGADCLVIDAEAEYEGRYAAAQEYIQTLRSQVGAEYPVGLASFPYVNYHESFPYSVFLGPEGAQFNVPQMYWKDIGTSVAGVFAVTYEQNLVYGRKIEPLGQTYESPSSNELVSFRSLASAYGASGLSLWDWQETSSTGWASLTKPLNTSLTVPSPESTAPLLKKGSTGDQVLWLQEHLAAAIPSQPITGIFEASTTANLEAFQTGKGLPATGETDASTWGYLLELAPVAVDWSGGGPKS